MNENINLVEILKDAPIGTKLWSPICGECEFRGLLSSSKNLFKIRVKYEEKEGNTTLYLCFSSQGKYCNTPEVECLLFPSKENRDWSTFIASKHFEPFQKSISEIFPYVKEFYKEIKLPEKWKDGDLLVHTDDDGSTHYAVYKETEEFNEYTQPYSMLTYISVNKHVYGINTIIFKDGWKLASDEEYKEFYELLHKHGVDWDAEKKQVVDWRWKPNDNEGYYSIFSDGTVHLCTWFDDSRDNSHFSIGNCFKTKKEAEAMAEKIKKLLNAES